MNFFGDNFDWSNDINHPEKFKIIPINIQIYLKVWTKLTIIHSNVLKYEEVGSKTQIIHIKLLKTDSLFLTVAIYCYKECDFSSQLHFLKLPSGSKHTKYSFIQFFTNGVIEEKHGILIKQIGSLRIVIYRPCK